MEATFQWHDCTAPMEQEDTTRFIDWRYVNEETGQILIRVTQYIYPAPEHPEPVKVHMHVSDTKLYFMDVERAKAQSQQHLERMMSMVDALKATKMPEHTDGQVYRA